MLGGWESFSPRATSGQIVARIWAWRTAGNLVFRLRGGKMMRQDDLFSEVSSALQFPWYFGENWDALDECMKDLDWFPTPNGIYVVITDAKMVLRDDGQDLEVFVDCLNSMIDEFSVPIALGESWDRPALPCVISLADEPDLSRWSQAGARI